MVLSTAQWPLLALMTARPFSISSSSSSPWSPKKAQSGYDHVLSPLCLVESSGFFPLHIRQLSVRTFLWKNTVIWKWTSVSLFNLPKKRKVQLPTKYEANNRIELICVQQDLQSCCRKFSHFLEMTPEKGSERPVAMGTTVSLSTWMILFYCFRGIWTTPNPPETLNRSCRSESRERGARHLPCEER